MLSVTACNPSDVAAQIALLEKYKRTRFDILGRLETDLAILVMSRLAVPDILNLRLVSILACFPVFFQ